MVNPKVKIQVKVPVMIRTPTKPDRCFFLRTQTTSDAKLTALLAAQRSALSALTGKYDRLRPLVTYLLRTRDEYALVYSTIPLSSRVYGARNSPDTITTVIIRQRLEETSAPMTEVATKPRHANGLFKYPLTPLACRHSPEPATLEDILAQHQ